MKLNVPFKCMLPTTHMNKADCINKKGPKLVGTEIKSIMVALYRNATEYPTAYHLTLLLDKYTCTAYKSQFQEKFSPVQNKITDSSSSQCSVMQSCCSICMTRS